VPGGSKSEQEEIDLSPPEHPTAHAGPTPPRRARFQGFL
jgi:hypothetical protein